MGAPQLADERPSAAELGEHWVKLEEHAQAGAFAHVRVAAAAITKELEGRDDPESEVLRARLKETIEYGRNRAFEVGMEAVGRSFMGLYEAAAKMQGEPVDPKPKKRGRKKRT
ncbi:MAG: hypothetical protein AAFQ82_07785 [Myxococcota bacterium]